MQKKLISLLIVCMIFFSAFPISSAGTAFSDVPDTSWATEIIASATDYGLLEGMGSGHFGYGSEISRAQFVTVLCRMFSWELIIPKSPSFTDVLPDSWYYMYVETALLQDVMDGGDIFSPETAITREDMAVMLVRALGYTSLAVEAVEYDIPFTDVYENKGYIAIAYDIGMINGTSPTTFSPDNTAKREEAAAMLVRVYEKYISKTDFLHGFYAFSSYDQRYVTEYMDTVSLGWSEMCFDIENGVRLNTTSENGNAWTIPFSYESITSYLDANGVKAHLNVFMDTTHKITLPDGTGSNSIKELLLSESNRTAAVAVIIDELTREYTAIGKNPYSGVTVDFEGLKGEELKSGFTAFLTLLSEELKDLNMTLYVAVHPVVADDIYYDGYDYREIGRLADKVILMAHDYNTNSLDEFIGTEWYKTTALTPITSVYYSLKAITDSETGVEDRSKIVLAISFSNVSWEITEDNKVKDGTIYTPSISTVYTRLLQSDTVTGWSDQYKNPYAIYYTESGQKFFLWYENTESVTEKINLAKLFGITGISLWRIGIIPDYTEVYDVWNSFVK